MILDLESGLDLPLADNEDHDPGRTAGAFRHSPRFILDEMKRSYLVYAMSVIVARALPDVRDGLKRVHRRILYAMYENGFEWNKSYKKSARTVGDVIGKYPPHGDQSVYDALVRLAQDFSMRVPLDRRAGQFRLGGRRYGGRDAVQPNPASPKIAQKRCSTISTRTPSTSSPTTTVAIASRRFCRRSFPTCWSTAPAASRSAWQPTSCRTISAR